MSNELEKSEQPNPDEVLAAIQSFNDPSIIINLFNQLGWRYSVEIKETVALAQQNANMSIKFKAIKYLRELLREAAETAGYTARVSQTIPDAQGGTTTFSAKRISGILNPVKKIESTEIKETQNDKKEIRTEPDRGSNRGQSQTQSENTSVDSDGTTSQGGTDTGRAFPIGDVESGGTEPPDGGETSRQSGGGFSNGDDNSADSNRKKRKRINNKVSSNPCIKSRPPTCNRDLFPGISSAED